MPAVSVDSRDAFLSISASLVRRRVDGSFRLIADGANAQTIGQESWE